MAWFKEFVEEKMKNKLIRKIVFFTVLALVLVVVGSVVFHFTNNKEAEVDTEYLMAQLTKSSELTAAKLTYTGFTEYTDEGVIILNRSDFKMVYKATARAGINIDEVKITADDVKKVIYLTIPKATVQDVKVDPTSMKFFDTHFALFNVDEKEDGNRAVALAEKEAKDEVAKMGILEMADEQAASLLKGILANAIPDGYVIQVK